VSISWTTEKKIFVVEEWRKKKKKFDK